MSMVLKGIRREVLGSRAARRLRSEGRFPAVVQLGAAKEPIHISLNEHDFLKARSEHEHVYEIDIDGQTDMALVSEIQWDVLGEHVQHIEFKRVVKGVLTDAEVELEFLGVPKGGILNKMLDHVTIRTIPRKIPDKIEVVVDEMDPTTPLHAGDLNLPEDVQLVLDPKTLIATVVPPRGMAEEAPEAVEGAEGEPGAAAEEGSARPE